MGTRLFKNLSDELEGWTLKSGTVYPALRRLVQLGLISKKTVKQETGPDKDEYKLTAKGLRVLVRAIQGLGPQLQSQDSLWEYLSASLNGESADVLMEWVTRERHPMAFVMMRRHCDSSSCCGQVHHDFLIQYRNYLQKELEWVEDQLAELKNGTCKGGEKG